jgi:hypothetical protein
MQRICLATAGLLITLSLTGSAAAQAGDLPPYKSWAGWREGASTTMKTESLGEGAKQVITTTVTLKKVAADKVVLDVAMTIEVAGQKFEQPATPIEIEANKAESSPDENAKITRGRETLTINGKKLDCEWTEIATPDKNTKKTWTCKDVPGGIVKETWKSDGSNTLSTLLEFKGQKK